MKLKDGVVWQDMHPKIEDARQLVEKVYEEFKTELVITSGRDGKHGDNSLHYSGRAMDTRTFNILENLLKRLKEVLGSEYDIVLEKDHIHIEWDPNHDSQIRR